MARTITHIQPLHSSSLMYKITFLESHLKSRDGWGYCIGKVTDGMDVVAKIQK